VSEHEVRLDKTNQIMMRARQMGSGAAHWYNDQLATLIEAGTSGTAFDGVAFFSNASGIVRPYDNYGTGALGQIALETAVAEMRSFVGRSGKRLGVRPTHLVVPPELEFTAKRILLTNQEGPTLTRSEADVFAGRLQLIVLDSLTAAAPWYLMDLSKPIRPFFMQELLPLRVMDNQGNLTDSYMQSRTYKFSADGECAFGYSLPFLCYKSTGA
jgi:phage major head subunit gpT-like protein